MDLTTRSQQAVSVSRNGELQLELLRMLLELGVAQVRVNAQADELQGR